MKNITPTTSNNIQLFAALESQRDEARAKVRKTVEVMKKVSAWLGKLAEKSDNQETRNRGRFDSLADACRFDAANYRKVKSDIDQALSAAAKEPVQ